MIALSRRARQLTASERLVYAALVRAARNGLPCPTGPDLQAMLGVASPSSVTKVLQRIERKGHIHIASFARSRVVTIVRTGKSTRPPANAQSHWRRQRAARIDPATRHTLDGRAPAPALHAVERDHGGLADEIRLEAFRDGCALPDFLSHLVLLGWRQHVAKKLS